LKPNSSERTYVVQIAIVIIIISVGIRQSFGIFLRPLVLDLNISRETFSLAIAIQQLIYGFPLIGILADRYGSRWVAIGGGRLYCMAIFWFAIRRFPRIKHAIASTKSPHLVSLIDTANSPELVC
jgi:MFS family permease